MRSVYKSVRSVECGWHALTWCKICSQTTPVPCEWALPRSTAGVFDRDKLNVRWSVENDQTTLLRASSKADCQNDAWFYDDALFPTRVIACD